MNVADDFDVYNMDFPNKKGFSIGFVEFLPRMQFWSKYEGSDPTNRKTAKFRLLCSVNHVNTGIMKIHLNRSETRMKEPDHLQDMLFEYRLLLSFAHRHNVFFEPAGFSSEKHPQDSNVRFLHASWRERPGIESSIIRRVGVEAFLQHSIPLLRNKEFQRKTAVGRALLWFCLVECFENPSPEIRYVCLWTGFETLAQAYAIENGFDKLKSFERLKEIRGTIKKMLIEMSVEQPEQWVRKLTEHALIIDVVAYALDKYGLHQSERILRSLYALRNDIAHGKRFSFRRQENITKLRVLSRILALLSLRALTFNQPNLIMPHTIDRHLTTA